MLLVTLNSPPSSPSLSPLLRIRGSGNQPDKSSQPETETSASGFTSVSGQTGSGCSCGTSGLAVEVVPDCVADPPVAVDEDDEREEEV